MSFKTVLNSYCLPLLALTSISCAANNSASTKEHKVFSEPVFLFHKEKELGNTFLDLAWKIRKSGECAQYEANKIDICKPDKQISFGKTGLHVRRVKYYNTDNDNGYEFVDIVLSDHSFPAYTFKDGNIRKIRDLEMACHLDVETERLLYTKATEKITDLDLAHEKEMTINVLCFNALNQNIPAQNGECIYFLE